MVISMEIDGGILKIDYEYTSKVSKADIFRLTKLLEVSEIEIVLSSKLKDILLINFIALKSRI